MIIWKSNPQISRRKNSVRKRTVTAGDNDQIEHLDVLCSSIWIRKRCEEWSKSVLLATPTKFEMQTIYLRAFLLIAYDSPCQAKKHLRRKAVLSERERERELGKTALITHKYSQVPLLHCLLMCELFH